MGDAGAVASGVAVKAGISAATIGIGVGVSTGGWIDASLSIGYGGYGGYGYGGYGYGYGGWYGWYWGSGWPSYCWAGSGFWWGACWGWGGYGFGYGRYSPYYYPYYGGAAYWYPFYGAAYSAPVVYQTIVYGEEAVVEEPVIEDVYESGRKRRDDRVERAAKEYLALGDKAFTDGRYADAVRYYAKAVEWSPDDPVLYLVLSDALFATGDYHYAAYALRRSLEIDPSIAMLVIDKREFYGVKADFDAQVAVLEAYVQDHFLDDDARLVLAANYLFGAAPEKCVELLESPISLELRESQAGAPLLASAKAEVAKLALEPAPAMPVPSDD